MTELYLIYSEYRTGGGICEGQENDSWPNFEDTYIEFSPTGVLASRDHAGVFPETFEVAEEVNVGDTIHVVIVRYGDGDTFSHTNGYWHVMGASTDLIKAQELSRAIESGAYTGDEEAAATSYYRGYMPWTGYFASFESCDVHTFVVS